MLFSARISALVRATTQAMNRVVPVHGLNVGGGVWTRLGWHNVDERHSLDSGAKVPLDAGSRFPFAAGSIALVFSSHFFEHVDDATAENLFRESLRVLRPGGVLRVSVPDFDRLIERYLAGDDAFFDDGDCGLAPRFENWRMHGVAPTRENKLSYMFFGFDNKADDGRWPPWHADPSYYCGPAPNAEPAQIKALAEARDAGGLSRYLVALSPPTAYSRGHINWWTERKLVDALISAGFTQAARSTFRGSQAPELRAPAFDNRPGLSLFVEARK